MTDQPDIEAIVERHNGSHSVRCVYWANSDPNDTRCDTVIVIERLRAVEAERDRAESLGAAYRSTAARMMAERDRWREDAERLAETLRAAIRYDGGPERRWQIARDDLAAHDAVTKEQG